ncbi:MAG: DEAD/DEAH box helicase [Dehalococcoidia bacterium]|nr:MAG: DEAD/DEAH box helicase [Dehalococcoidia bacterium]
MDISTFVDHVIPKNEYDYQIAHIEHIPSRSASFADVENPLPDILEKKLKEKGLLPLYSHQAQAIGYARHGNNVIVATSSASGKSLCYNLPVIEKLLEYARGCAIYLFPTKALAQDQLRSFTDTFCPQLVRYDQVATFDGDTPLSQRATIRKNVRLMLSNPDMLHFGILPNHRSWSRFLRHLEFVVIDEAHSYRGVFGSHVALVIRRLRRLCLFYGSSPLFICCSATINNPEKHAEELVGLPFHLVDKDGSPKGGKDFIFWNPPTIDDAKSIRRSANSEAATLFSELVSNNIRTLTFSRTRRLTELITTYSKKRLNEISASHANKIKAYRAGYLPEERRLIEHEIFSGKLIGAVATSALELGIDVGDLEATILTGYPGTIASTWQQAGRSGRRNDNSLSILIALDNPLDQYLMHHPEFFFGKSFENAIINLQNPYISRSHMLCAAWELPLSDADVTFFGSDMSEKIEVLMKQGALKQRYNRIYPSPSISYPAQDINIRATSGDNITLINSITNLPLETVDINSALFQLHSGAIYLHQGESYLVNILDLTSKTAYAEPINVPYYTIAKDITDLHIIKTTNKKTLNRIKVYLGQVEVTTTIVSFRKKALFTEEVIGEEPLDLPPQQFPTIALWFDLPKEVISSLARANLDLSGALHATEHAAIAMLPLFAMCDRNDIGGVSTPFHPDSGKPQVFIYDGYPGGIGIAEKGYILIQQLWQATFDTIANCPCHTGCPSCIQSPKCGNNNEPLDKKAARLILEELLLSKDRR